VGASTTTKPVTSADICVALRLRFPPNSHALMFEVAPSTGGGTRYADAVAVGLWASHGHLVQGIEIKVSRADFLNEMKHPEKSEPVMRYCGRWWLACPKGMIEPKELPPTWGMLELHADGTLRPKVKAPILSAVPVTLNFFASLCRRRAGCDEEMTELVIEKRVKELREEDKRRLVAEINGEKSRIARDVEHAAQQYEAIKAETGIDLTHYKTGDEVIDAINAYRAVNGDWRSNLVNLRTSLERSIRALDDSGFSPKGKTCADGGMSNA